MKKIVILWAIAAALTMTATASPASKHYGLRSLSDARLSNDPQELLAQQDHSSNVLRFFHNRRWMVARHHRSCGAVPWARTCHVARSEVRLHRWLKHTAALRYQRIAFSPTVVRAWVLRYHPCLDRIIQLENKSYDPTLSFGGGHGNTSIPYGIPQANPGTKMSSAGADWATNPYTQLKWMIGYVGGPSRECAAAYNREHSYAY